LEQQQLSNRILQHLLQLELVRNAYNWNRKQLLNSRLHCRN